MTGREGFRKCLCGGWGWNRPRSGRRTSPLPLLRCDLSDQPPARPPLVSSSQGRTVHSLSFLPVRVWVAGTRAPLPSASACSATASLNGTTSPRSWGTRGRESGKYCPCHPAGIPCSGPGPPGVLVPASLTLQGHLAASLTAKQPLAPPGPQTIPFLVQCPGALPLSLSGGEGGGSSSLLS